MAVAVEVGDRVIYEGGFARYVGTVKAIDGDSAWIAVKEGHITALVKSLTKVRKFEIGDRIVMRINAGSATSVFSGEIIAEHNGMLWVDIGGGEYRTWDSRLIE